ncbi:MULTISPECIES: hypothetical protein [Nonomuraea]|uniref:Uncharacterized protein n=2 Tax=Nonomuraea TaxID=83681 RepID=A0A7W5VA08_9ACTN|nr:hypothetical protein [Nonomuraea dietziae]MBB3728413.1 hypothetical protein [Nonomuraea dietziae]
MARHSGRFARFRRRWVARLAAAPATSWTVGRLHRAAANLVEVTAEVNAYAGLLEEKAEELRDRTMEAGRRPPS